MAMKPNLDQGNPAAKRRNSPAPLAKTKRSNLVQTQVSAKPRNMPKPYQKNNEAQTMRPGPSSVAPKMSNDDGRIRGEITRRSHPTSHSRKGR